VSDAAALRARKAAQARARRAAETPEQREARLLRERSYRAGKPRVYRPRTDADRERERARYHAAKAKRPMKADPTAELSPRARRAFKRFREGASWEELAQLTGLSGADLVAWTASPFERSDLIQD
jgi:hypothetical protein